MKHINGEIIAVGTELLLGQIPNTNGQWISEQLALDGINVLYHGVVGDNLERVADTFQQAKKRSDVIIITGGLGPTEDDLTREAFQKISHLELIEHAPSMKKINDYFNDQHTKMTHNNRKQARVFKGAKVIDNQVGMAPGMIVDYADKTWIFLPGVPSEMKSMMLNDCLPYLREAYGHDSVISSKVLRFIGIGEANLEDELQDIIRQQTNPTIALLAQHDGMTIRLTAKAETTQQAQALLLHTQQAIEEKVGDFLYGVDQQTIEEKIVSMLKEKQLTLSAAESLTGGMFIEKIISIPGASEICPGGMVSYSQQVKAELLGVSQDTLNKHGSVSSECASEMATHASARFKTTIGLSFTGVAGPSSSEGHLPGTVFIGFYHAGDEVKTDKFVFHGDRHKVRQKAVNKGLEMLYHFLKKD